MTVNDKGASLTDFTAQWKEPLVLVLFVNSSVRQSTDHSPDTPNTTPNTGNGAGVSLYEGSSPDNLTLLAFMDESLPSIRKIRAHRTVQEDLL